MKDGFYSKYIKSPQWEAKRQLYFQNFGKYCKACHQTRGPIHVHHMTYERLGRELMSDLISLCPSCHNEVDRLYRRTGRRDLRMTTMAVVRQKQANRLKGKR